MTGVSSSGRGSKTRGSGLQPFNPQRLHAAVLKSAPQFKVRTSGSCRCVAIKDQTALVRGHGLSLASDYLYRTLCSC